MKRFVLLITIVVLALLVKAQEVKFEWVKGFGGVSDDIGHSIKLDKFGNIYTLGTFQGTVDFDPGPDSFNLTSTGEWGSYDMVIIKLNPKGDFIWAKNFGDIGWCMDIDANGNIYTTGWFYGTVDFDPSEGIYNLTSKGRQDIFISKLDNRGNFVWAKNFGGNSHDEGLAITVDKYGNVFATGGFIDTADFDPGPDTFNLIAVTLPTKKFSNDIYILKLNTDGNFVWAKRVGGRDSDAGNSIALDKNGNVYLTGVFEGNVIDFDPGQDSFTLNSKGEYDIFVLKLDSKGDFLWAEQIGGPDSDFGNGIVIDRWGNPCITGWFNNKVDFNSRAGIFYLETDQSRHSGYPPDIFTLKLNPKGDFLWAKKFGGNKTDEANGITVDLYGNVYTIGLIAENVEFDSSINNYKESIGEYVFISKLDANGELIWEKRFIGNSNNDGKSITVNSKGDIFITGLFQGNTDFNPDSSVNYNLLSKGYTDIFIHKLSQPNFKKKSKPDK